MYDARKAAVEKLLDETAATSREVFKTSHPEDLEKRVRDQLDDYFEDRKKAFETGLGFLDAPLPPDAHQERWSDHFSDAGSKAAEEIAKLVDDDKLIKTPFVSAVSRIASEESGFFAALAAMPLPTAQGKVLEWYGQYVREEKNLKDDWDELVDDGSDLAKDLAEVMKEVAEIFEKAIKKAAEKARDAEEVLRRWLPAVEKGEEAIGAAEPGPVGTAIQAMQHALDSIAGLRPSVETRAGRFRDLYKSHETVTVVLFGKTRKEVAEFLGKVNLDKAVALFEEAGKKSVALAQKLKPDGQRDDAEDLVGEMVTRAHETLADFEEFFEEFVDDFGAIFLGPVGDRTVEDLVNRQLSQRSSEHFQRLNVQSELKKIHDAARKSLNLPISRLPDDQRKALEKLLDDDLERLALATNEAIDLSQSERVRFMMKLAWDGTVDRIKRLPGKVL